MKRLIALTVLLASCGNETSLKGSATCDGQKQSDEEYVDAPFDIDGDGFFNLQNEDCAAHYALEDLDCDDSNDRINPASLEKECNNKDDDCDPTTLDGDDEDGDGHTHCDDCDNTDPDVHPNATEECGDGIDNNCNGKIDEGCDNNYSGDWSMEPAVSITCNLVRVNVYGFRVTDIEPSFFATPIPNAQQPGQVTGNIGYNSGSGRDEFSASNSLPGGCTENYTLFGGFTSATEWEGTFTATYNGLCGNCQNTYQFPFTGKKQ